jgi:ABC-type transporter Mla subunit MlaD
VKDEQIEKIRSAVESADHIPAEKKAELLDLLSKINPVIAKASQTNAEHAQSIAKLVKASATAAARKDESPERLNKLLQELKRSAENFEASHPDLVAFVTEYTALLSALGI